MNQPVNTDGDGDGGLYPQFYRTVQSLFSEYRDTNITICLEDVEAAVNTAYEYGARAPRAYARRIIEQQRWTPETSKEPPDTPDRRAIVGAVGSIPTDSQPETPDLSGVIPTRNGTPYEVNESFPF